MNLLLLFVIFLFQIVSYSQHSMFVKPFFGHSIGVNGVNTDLRNINTPNSDLIYRYKKTTNLNRFDPLTFGFKIEKQFNKHSISSGIIFGDQTSSEIETFFIIKKNSPLNKNKMYKILSHGSGMFLTKIPLNYNYKLISFNHFQKKNNKFLDILIHTGFNLFIMDVWRGSDFSGEKKFSYDGSDTWLIQPFQEDYIIGNGDKLSIITYETNLNKGWSLGFDLGFRLDWYVRNKRRITTLFYYEQGTRNVSALVQEIYVNNVFIGHNASISKGSAIQFKILFPIEIFKKN